MSNKCKYIIKFIFISNPDVFSANHIKFKYYYYCDLESFIFDLKHDLSKDFNNCIEMVVIKND